MEKINSLRHIMFSFDAERKLYHIELNDAEIEQAVLNFLMVDKLHCFDIKGADCSRLVEGFEKNVRKGISLTEEAFAVCRDDISYCERKLRSVKDLNIRKAFDERLSYLNGKKSMIEKASKAYYFLLDDCKICHDVYRI